jgi:hypothetical protein
VGAEWLGMTFDRVPQHDVGQAFLKHEVMLNELYLGLVPPNGNNPVKVPRGFRWVLGEYLDLPFHKYVQHQGTTEKRRLQPDAMLEVPSIRQRFFIEFETGSATVKDAKKSSSTLAKLLRYSTFLSGWAGAPINGTRSTFYSRTFPDGCVVPRVNRAGAHRARS